MIPLGSAVVSVPLFPADFGHWTGTEISARHGQEVAMILEPSSMSANTKLVWGVVSLLLVVGGVALLLSR
jgi:hypothetical protein